MENSTFYSHYMDSFGFENSTFSSQYIVFMWNSTFSSQYIDSFHGEQYVF